VAGHSTYGESVNVPLVTAGMVTVEVGRVIVSGMVTVTRSSSVTVGVTVPVAVIVLVAIIVTWEFTTLNPRAKPISGKKIV
jgi:hypothetical protein